MIQLVTKCNVRVGNVQPNSYNWDYLVFVAFEFVTLIYSTFLLLFIVEYREITDIKGPTRDKGVKSRPGEAEEESSPEEGEETVDQEYF